MPSARKILNRTENQAKIGCMTPSELRARLERARSVTLELYSRVPSHRRGEHSGPDRWSPAMVLEHLRLVDQSTAAVVGRLARRAGGIAGAAPTEIDMPHDLDALVDTVMDSPVVAGAEPVDRDPETVAAELDVARAQLNESVDAALAVDCGARTFPHPIIGPLTAYEWIAFVSVHETGHHRQLRDILDELAG